MRVLGNDDQTASPHPDRTAASLVEPDPARVIDVHHHYVAAGEAETLFASAGARADPDSYEQYEIAHRRESMTRSEINQAVVMPGHGYLRPNGVADTRRINDQIADYQCRNADIFPAALGIVEPQHGIFTALQELHRIHSQLGLNGVTFHTRFQGVPTDDPIVTKIIEQAADLGMMPFVHAGESSEESLWRILNLARQLPEVTIVVLDGLTGFEQTNEALLVAELAPNLIFDTAGCPNFAFVERLIARVGPSRVVFGTNTYSSTQPSTRKHVLTEIQNLDPASAHDIAGETIAKLMKLT